MNNGTQVNLNHSSNVVHCKDEFNLPYKILSTNTQVWEIYKSTV